MRGFILFLVSFLLMAGSVATLCSTGCPFRWTPFRGKCYLLQPQKLNYETAEQNCRSLSTRRKEAHLVSITSKEELDFVQQLVTVAWDNFDPPLSWKEIWIGLRVGASAETTRWEDGSPVAFSYFYGYTSPAVPYSSSPRCTLFTISHDTWKAWHDCNARLPTVCKMQRD